MRQANKPDNDKKHSESEHWNLRNGKKRLKKRNPDNCNFWVKLRLKKKNTLQMLKNYRNKLISARIKKVN